MMFLLILFALFAENDSKSIEKCQSIACVKSAASIVEKMSPLVDPCEGKNSTTTHLNVNDAILKIFTVSRAVHFPRIFSHPMKSQLLIRFL